MYMVYLYLCTADHKYQIHYICIYESSFFLHTILHHVARSSTLKYTVDMIYGHFLSPPTLTLIFPTASNLHISSKLYFELLLPIVFLILKIT